MFYFTEKVVDLKAWELYIGNAFWTLFVGIILIVFVKVLDLLGLENKTVDHIAHDIGSITYARDPRNLLYTGNHTHQPSPHPTHKEEFIGPGYHTG